MLIYDIIVTPYYVIDYNIMVNISMCYSNSTIVNIYWHCRKLIYEIIVNRGGYKITYFVVLSLYIYIHTHPLLFASLQRSLYLKKVLNKRTYN
jgi:hypothetical protein